MKGGTAILHVLVVEGQLMMVRLLCLLLLLLPWKDGVLWILWKLWELWLLVSMPAILTVHGS